MTLYQPSSYDVDWVACGDAAYPVLTGAGLDPESLLAHLQAQGPLPDRWLIITDETIAAHYLAAVQACFEQQAEQVLVHCLPTTSIKTLQTAQTLWDTLIEHQFTRSCGMIALGGGTIGDLTGFVASTYLRGIPWLQIPTTLLSQVDAGIGGKTAINYRAGKNLIGTFHQPRAVINHLDYLATLQATDYQSAWSEIIKYALIAAPELLTELEAQQALFKQRTVNELQPVIRRCAQLKAQYVAQDENDTADIRIFLNFGHTLGHAIEACLNYETLTHGEAVGIGLVAALRLSEQLCGLEPGLRLRVEQLLQGFSLPTVIPKSISVASLIESMQHDKKNQHGQLRYLGLQALGQPVVLQEISQASLESMLRQMYASQEVCE